MVKQTLTQIEPEASALRNRADELRTQLADVENSLKSYVSRCPHSFNVSYDSIYHKAYTIPGDKPGTMGVDWQGPMYVKAKTEERWKRECGKCGLVEYTMRTEAEVHKKPVW